MNEHAGLLIEKVTYSYGPQPALCGVTVTVGAGECVSLMGPSGCGKSTLLLVAAGILVPDHGRIVIGNQTMPASVDGRAALRRQHVGLVFQFGDLVGELTLRDNVSLAAELAGAPRRAARVAADSLLGQVGLKGLETRKPSQVSGGQAQRAAIARALVHRPRLILADEPTGALDSANASTALDLLLGLGRAGGASVLIATHDAEVAARCDRTVRLTDGRVVDDEIPDPAQEPVGVSTAQGGS